MKIQNHILLANKVWFGTGGHSKYYCEPKSTEDMKLAVSYAHENNLQIAVLGKGANVLISDDGFDGLVIAPQLDEITIIQKDETSCLVQVGSGQTMPMLISWCLENNILGLEEFSGIPGTVGGAAFINLHYFKFLLSDFLVSATVMEIETNNVLTVDTKWFEFGYDTSKLFERKHILLTATFKLKACTDIEAAYAQGRSAEIIRHRVQRYPYKNTCGSFFKNFAEDQVTLTAANGRKLIFAAYYLDKIGIKGELSHGGARVSHQHANMIVTSKGAKSSDVIQLARSMQEKVYKEFGLLLETECEFIGFKEYPLYTDNVNIK